MAFESSARAKGWARHWRCAAVFGVGAVSVLVSLAVGCLPDLAALDPVEAGSAAAVRGCGDHLIDPGTDAGAGETCDPGDAQVPGCESCKITCEGTLDPVSGHCYFGVGEHAAYYEAVSRCRAASAHVVTLSGPEEIGRVESISDGGEYWVGLAIDNQKGAYAQDRATEPGWPRTGSCPGCFAVADEAGAFPRSPNVPAGSNTDCVASLDRVWVGVPCSGDGGVTRKTLCEREPPGQRSQDCSFGLCFTLPRTEGTKRYLLVIDPLSPASAVETCASVGGTLVLLDSREEREQLAHELVEGYGAGQVLTFWVGLRADSSQSWIWDDDAGLDSGRPLPWGSGQPNGSGAARAFMRIDAQRFDSQLVYSDDGEDAGAAVRPFICQRPP